MHIILPSIQKSLFVDSLNQKVRLTICPFAKKLVLCLKLELKIMKIAVLLVRLIHAIRSFRLSIYVLTIIFQAPQFTSFWHSYFLSNTIHSDVHSIVLCSKNLHKVLIFPNFLKTYTFFCLLIFWIDFFESHFFRFRKGDLLCTIPLMTHFLIFLKKYVQ